MWNQNDWSYILYALAHCTLGDLLILLVLYEFIAALCGDRRWHRHSPARRGFAFTILGVCYMALSEIGNVRIRGAWGYTELMPIVPVIGIGGMPLLQWVLIPPVLIWLMRLLPDAPRPTR